MQQSIPNIAIVIAASCALFASCEKISGLSSPTPILVSVDRVDKTRSHAITDDNFKSTDGFIMDAYVGDYYTDPENKTGVVNPWEENAGGKYFTASVQYTGGQWVMAEHYWIKNTPTTFWCYAPITTKVPSTWSFSDPESVNANTRQFSFNMPHGQSADGKYIDADKADDLIFAYKEQNYVGNNQFVNLTFHHALSQIVFCVSPDDGSYDKNLVIKDISITLIPTTGSCTFNGEPDNPAPEKYFTWESLGNEGNVSQTYAASFASAPLGWDIEDIIDENTGQHSKTLYSSKNNFFIIPFSLDDYPRAEVSITFTDPNGDRVVSKPLETPDKPSAGVFGAGYYYRYKIGATDLGRDINLSVSLADWKIYDDKIYTDEGIQP